MNEPVKSGPRKGAINSPEELNMMLDHYYDLHGWDRQTGIPTPEVLEELELLNSCSEHLPS